MTKKRAYIFIGVPVGVIFVAQLVGIELKVQPRAQEIPNTATVIDAVIVVEELPEVVMPEKAPVVETVIETIEVQRTEIVPVYIPQPPTPPVTINNNITNNTAPEPEPVITIVDTTPLTDLEKAREITDYYKWDTASVTYWGADNERIRVAYKDTSLTVQLVGDWEEVLKANINRIK